MTIEETANHLVKELGKDGGWRQAAEEMGNSDLEDDQIFWSEVMSVIIAL